jgi:hypothetical protein
VSNRTLSKLAILAFVLAGCASPNSQMPRVVWLSGSRAYVALRDSTAVLAGDRVRFQRDGRTVASGIVARVEHGELAQVQVTSGPLGSERELLRTTVVVERASVAKPSTLRIGLPSAARGTAFFSCRRLGVRPQWPDSAYRADAPSSRTARFVRDPRIPLDKPWPDTLVVRFYDESADEEIAIERAELDVAVFWPSELSSHMRTSPRWSSPLMGIRTRGVVALVWDDPSSIDPAALEREKAGTFAALNRDLFHGDLLLLEASDPDSGGPSDLRPRFLVDPRCPGRAELQRYLDRWVPAPTNGVVRIEYQVDRTGSPLFAIRCPVVSRPDLRAYLSALGPDRVADLMDCVAP